MKSDPSLVEQLRRREPQAFETLLREYGGRMLAVTRRITGDDEEARDALQDAMVSAYRAADRFQGDSTPQTWLHRIAVNAALQRIRKRSHRSELSLEGMLPTFTEDGHRADPGRPGPDTPDVEFDREELRSMVRAKIDQLPTNYRTVLMLRDIEGLSGDEVAQMLSITANAVKVRLHRARQALRELLDPEWNPRPVAETSGGA